MVRKKKVFATVALSSSSQDRRVISIAKQCLEVLSSQGMKVILDESLSLLKSENRISKEEYIVSNSDLLVAIGGDGTMLNCSRKYGSQGIPILGINLGNLGFLTDLAPEDLTSGLVKVLEGHYIEDKRFFLETSISGNSEKYIALNEVVIHSGAIAQLIEFDLFINKVFVYRQKADGLIVSSPTGSTAYSLSGGGPIVHPDVDAFTLLPMLPQSLSSSSLLVKTDSTIRVDLILSKQKGHISFDSHDSLILRGENQITIKKAKASLKLIHPEDHDFFASCRNKLGWSSGLKKN